MATETTRWDIQDYLTSDERIADYLSAVFEAGDPDEIRDALGHVARAKGMSLMAQQAGMTRAGLYKALGENGNPTLDTLLKITRALGVKLAVAA